MTRNGNWIQFSATVTPPVSQGKRITKYAIMAYKIARPGDVGVAALTVNSNWVRCDRALKGSKSTGCVVPNFIPKLRYSKRGRYPDLANHIYRAQRSSLPGKPGGKALTRLDDTKLRRKNGNRACPSGLRGRVGAPRSTSCDEYPFRSTYQGAYTVDPRHNRPRVPDGCNMRPLYSSFPKGYSRCFINARQNENGGRWVGRFYGTGQGGQRLLDGDGFYVSIY